MPDEMEAMLGASGRGGGGSGANIGYVVKEMYVDTTRPIVNAFQEVVGDSPEGKLHATGHLALSLIDAGLQVPAITYGLLIPVGIGVLRGFEEHTSLGKSVARQLLSFTNHEVRQNYGAAQLLRGLEWTLIGLAVSKGPEVIQYLSNLIAQNVQAVGH